MAFSYQQNIIKIFNDKTKKIVKYEYELGDKFKLNYRSYWQMSGAEQQWNGKNHIFFQKEPFAKDQVLKRLMRKNVNYKNHMNSVKNRYEEIPCKAHHTKTVFLKSYPPITKIGGGLGLTKPGIGSRRKTNP